MLLVCYWSIPDNPTPVIDRCINCTDHEEVQATITIEFGEANYNTRPIDKILDS